MKILLLCVSVMFVFAVPSSASESSDSIKVSMLIEKMKGKKPSASSGVLRDGKLVNPAMLPVKGIGYYLAHPDRNSNFGNDRLVFGLMRLCVKLKDILGSDEHHRLRIHDLSSKEGGKLPRHINHQMGLDVDIALYATDLKGKIVKTAWRSFDETLKSEDGKYLFDTARNWEVVEGMINNKHFGKIRAILISDPLKKKLLEQAEKKLQTLKDTKQKKAFKKVIEQAEVLMRQPKSSPHDNHFHLSLDLVND